MSAVVVMADAFAGVDALGREGRAALAGALGCSPDRIEAAPLGDLGDQRYRRRLVAAVVAVVAAVEPEPVLAVLSGRALRELAPAAGLLGDGAGDSRPPPRRARSMSSSRPGSPPNPFGDVGRLPLEGDPGGFSTGLERRGHGGRRFRIALSGQPEEVPRADGTLAAGPLSAADYAALSDALTVPQ